MEEDKVPVPQMLFMNEAYLRSQVLESLYDSRTSVAVKQEDEQCSQRLESYNTNTSVAVKQEDEQCSQRLESYNTNTSVAVKQEDEQCSQRLESYNTNTSVAEKQEDEQCSQRLESYNTNTSVAEKQEDEQCSQRLESYNTNTSVAVNQEDEQCSQRLESYNTNTSVAVKQEDEQCSPPSSLEIKTENPTVNYGLSNQTYDESLKFQRDEKEVDLTDHSSQLMRHNELDVTDRLVSSHSQTDRLITNGFSHNEGENDVNDESDMSYLLKSVKGRKQEISTDPDCYEIKIERDEQVDVPFYTNVCPTTSVDEMSSEFLECKQEIIQDSDEATDTEEHLDIAFPPEDAGRRDVDVHEEIKQRQPYVIVKKLDQLSIEKICQGLKNQMKKMTGEPAGAGPSHDATTTRVVGLEELKGKQPIVVIQKLSVNDLLKYNKCDRNSMKSVLSHDKKGNESSNQSQFDSWRENEDFMSNSKMKSPLRSLSTEGDSLVQQPQTINTSDSGSGKFSGSSHRSLAGELLEKQKTTDRTPVCNETSSSLRTDIDGKPYKCTVCDKAFHSNSYLTSHMRTHTGEKPYKCTFCDKAFAWKARLTSHMTTHTGEKPYKCTVCDEAFGQKCHLTQHMRLGVHAGKSDGYKCTLCDKVVSHLMHLVIHMRTHTGENIPKCTVCDKEFLSKSNLTIHMRTHTGEKPFKCTLCEKAFGAKPELKEHIKCWHNGEKPHKCPVCNKTFAYRLSKHMRIHTGEKPYKCTVCGEAFMDKFRLRNHSRKHIEKKSFVCTVCEKAFFLKSDLDSHMKLHTGERSYKCTECGKTFEIKSRLLRHMRVHTGEKPYKCPFCGKTFFKNSDCKNHIKRLHVNEKDHKCTVCSRSFVCQSELNKHMRKHQGKDFL